MCGSVTFERGFLFHLVLNKPLKLFKMVRLVFTGTERSKTDENELEVFATSNNEILLVIDDRDYICLDKSTAIKLVKTLKTEISKIEE